MKLQFQKWTEINKKDWQMHKTVLLNESQKNKNNPIMFMIKGWEVKEGGRWTKWWRSEQIKVKQWD